MISSKQGCSCLLDKPSGYIRTDRRGPVSEIFQGNMQCMMFMRFQTSHEQDKFSNPVVAYSKEDADELAYRTKLPSMKIGAVTNTKLWSQASGKEDSLPWRIARMRKFSLLESEHRNTAFTDPKSTGCLLDCSAEPWIRTWFPRFGMSMVSVLDWSTSLPAALTR